MFLLKILEKVNVPNQHVIFSESFENQHVSHVFIDHLYPSKYAIVSYPFRSTVTKLYSDEIRLIIVDFRSTECRFLPKP